MGHCPPSSMVPPSVRLRTRFGMGWHDTCKTKMPSTSSSLALLTFAVAALHLPSHHLIAHVK